MPDPLESVKSLARTYRSLAASNEVEKPDLAKRQTGHAQAMELLVEEVERSRDRLRSVKNALGDLSDLPPEVLAQLSVTKLDELEQQLRDIVASDDEVGLDVAIVELYRRHKVVHPRRFVMNKLYRMAQKGLIQAVEGRKGVYRIPSLSTDDDSPWGWGDDDDVPF